MTVVAGPNALLKYLRGTVDPVSTGGPTKLEVATSTWRDKTVVIPHKAEILRDWLLDNFMNSPVSSAESPLLQPEYLDLLLSVCSALNTGISPRLLCRFFGILATAPSSTGLTAHAVWTLESDQTGSLTDVWLEIWAAMVAVLSIPTAAAVFSPALLRLVEQRVDRYLAEGTASKKMFAALPSTLPLLARAVALRVPLRPETTGSILFPRTAQLASHSIHVVLEPLPKSDSYIPVAQHILRGYHAAIYRHRFQIFVQPTSSHVPHASYINEKLRAAVRRAFGEIQIWASSIACKTLDARVAYWASKLECWQSISEWSSYLETDAEWSRMLAHDAESAKALLRENGGSRLLQVSLGVLLVLEDLDHAATALDTETLAWCIKAPIELYADARALMMSSFRYHQLSQTEALWVSHALDAVQSLLSSVADRRSAQSIHRIISSGPLWSLPLRQRLGSIRQTRPAWQLLIQRTNELRSTEPSCVVMLSVISHIVTTIGYSDSESSEQVFKAMQGVLDQLATTSAASTSGTIDPLYAVGLSAVIRVGRMINPSIREQLGQTYGFTDWTPSCLCEELRREIVLWLFSRLTDEPAHASPILNHLILTLQTSPTSSSLSNLFGASDLAVIHELATPTQLEAFTQSLVSDAARLDWTTSSAGITDLSNVNDSLVKTSLDLVSRSATVCAGADLLLSLPISTFDRALRSSILDTLIEADHGGDMAVQSTVRKVLAFLPGSDLSKLPNTYLSRLELDTSLDDVQTPTELLIQAIIRGRIDTQSELPFVSLGARLILAQVVMERDFTQMPPALRDALETLAKGMLPAVSSDSSPETRAIVARFALWCGASTVNEIAMMWPDRGIVAGSARCEMLRLMCIDDHDRARYIHHLLSRSSLLSTDVIDREVHTLARQRDWYSSLLAICLEQATVPDTQDMAFRALAITLGTRIEGSGQAVIDLRQPLMRTLFQPTRGQCSPQSQIKAVHALVKYRARLLRVSDVARILDESTGLSSVDTIGVVYTLTTLRGELLADVVPLLVGYLCRQLTQIAVELVAPLARLLSALGQNRRHRQSARHRSLVNALGKHAPAVVTAYVRGWANPRGEIPIVQRRILQASIYSWCDIMVRTSHRGREGEGMGQPYGLGEGGPAESELWAELWIQWARQRYRGQG